MFKNKNSDPKRELPVVTDDILDICMDGTYYENMYISKKTFINLIVIGSNGAFVFIGTDDDKEIVHKMSEIQKYFDIPKKALYGFFFTEEGVYVANAFANVVEISDFYDSFNNIYTNLSRPEIDKLFLKMNYLKDLIKEAETPEEYLSDNNDNGKTYEHEGYVFEIKETYEREDTGDAEYVFSNLSDAEQQRISSIAESIQDNAYPDATYKIDPEGQEWILKDSSITVKGIDTGVIGEKKWFRLSDRNEIKMLLMTSFFGVFGIHKLAVGNIMAFLGYLLTSGGMGVFVVLDVLQFLFGSAGYNEVTYEENEDGELQRNKEKVYFKTIKSKWLVLIALFVAVVVSYMASKFIYLPILEHLINVLTNSAQNMDETTLEQNMNILDKIFSF